ncbi:unnamed protein product [[Candida] boidinii]|uniref:Unnamed protein product n=1 Tax=Candida boidinii TaxID=5477 RepID=A0A9W6SZ41_CANBO|nr:unnamed protein product [[Candida] boidinii]GMF98983.1 unnamed protein product [[Candida] boidinii]
MFIDFSPERSIAMGYHVSWVLAYSPSEMSVSADESGSSSSSCSGVSVSELPPADPSVADISSSDVIVDEPSSGSEDSAPFPVSV